MKRHLVAVILGMGLSISTTTSTYGAGQVYFNNYYTFGGIGAPIFMQDGTTPIAPGVFDISLFYQLGNVADPVSTGTLIATTQSGSGGTGAGYYDGGVVTIPDYPDSGAPPGGISFQVLVRGMCPASGGGRSAVIHLQSIATGNQEPTGLDIPSFDVSATILSSEFYWGISNGTVTITGYLGPGGKVSIPGTINGLPVTGIEPGANFRAGCGSYFSIEIPESVTNIAAKALEGDVIAIEVDAANPVYSSVDGVLFDKHQTTVVQYPVFRSAGSYTIPNTVTTIASWAFYGCRYVTNITIPNSVNDVEINAFDDAYGLTAISADSANPSYSSANGVLFNKSQTLLIRYPGAKAGAYAVPNSVTNIADYAFNHAYGLMSVSIPNSVISIGEHAFAGCHLTSLTIPYGVITMGSLAFLDNGNLTNVTISASVISIGNYLFQGCSILSAITVDPLNPAYTSLDGVLFNKNQTSLIIYPEGKTGNYTIPDGVTSIGDAAFAGCSKLANVTIPNSVTSIGSGAFASCDNLTRITIPNSVTSIGSEAFGNCTRLASVTIGSSLSSVGNYAFFSCTSLTNITIPNSVTDIGLGAFYVCTGLTVVTIPDSVTSIGDLAFADCNSLTNVTIGNGVTSIGEQAFVNCNRLASATIPDSVTSIGSRAFASCRGLASLVIGNSVISIGDSAFFDCGGLTRVTIPDSVTNIGAIAFAGCGRLTNVTIGTSLAIPSSGSSIGGGAFSFCTSLASVTVGNSVANIGASAFEDCTSLTSITIGNGVTCIGDSAFYECWSLPSLAIPNSVNSIGSSALEYCTSLTNVTVGYGVTNIGNHAFQRCPSLGAITVDALNSAYSSLDGVLFDKNQTILVEYPGGLVGNYTIPDGVIGIEPWGFAYCTRLTSVTIPDSVSSIGDYAFYDCTGLTNVTIGNGVTSIGDQAFLYCTSLTGVYSLGNAPSLGADVFVGDSNANIYYLPGTTGWGPTFGGRPTAIWTDVPVIETAPQTQTAEEGSVVGLWTQATNALPLSYALCFDNTNFINYTADGELELTNVQFSQAGVYTVLISNVLGAVTSAPVMLNVIPVVERRPVPGIRLTGEAGSSLNVEYTKSLGASPNWLPLDAVNLTNPLQYVFDVTTPLPPQRFYRTHLLNDPAVPVLDLHMVPAITLNGNVGDKLRLDCINQFGPTDAWLTLDTVTLTNTSQLYFDTSAVAQPARLYRIVPVP